MGDPGAGGPPDGMSPFDRGMGPGGPPPGMPGSLDPSLDDRPRNLALFRSVLTAYDEFSRSPDNKTDASLQSQAAWVYYKMGALSERLGNRDEADAAFERTLTIFDELAKLYPREPAYFTKFLRVCAAINPWQSDPAMRQAVEGRLRRMERALGLLLAASPTDRDYLRARMQLLAKLGLIRHAQDDPAAIGSLRQALAIANSLIERSPEEGYPHSDRSDVLEAYAMILENEGRTDQARKLLDAAFEDLEWVAADELKSESLATRMESVADDFIRLGDLTRSDQIQRRADEIDPRPPFAGRARPGRPFAPRREDSGPDLDTIPPR